MTKKDPTGREMQKKWSKLLAKIWADPQFKKKFLENPTKGLKDFGIDVPADVIVHIHENTPRAWHLTLSQPTEEFKEQDLDQIAAAGYCCCPITSKDDGCHCFSPFTSR